MLHMRKCKKASTKHAGETTQNGEQRMRYCPERRLIPLGLLHVTVLLCGSDTGAGRDLQDKRVLGREKRFLSRQAARRNPSGPIRRACVHSSLWLVLPSRNPSFTDSADRTP